MYGLLSPTGLGSWSDYIFFVKREWILFTFNCLLHGSMFSERDIWIFGSHVLTWIYFEGHHIIMVIHRSKLCKIKARYAGLSPHAPLTRRPLCWWRVPLSSLLSSLWLWTPGVTGCCHHTSAARSDLSPSFLILCNIIQRLTYNNLQPFRQFIDVITITSSIQQT